MKSQPQLAKQASDSGRIWYDAYMNATYKTQVKDRFVTFTHLGNASLPPFSQVTSVAAIPFTKEGQLVVVNLHHRGLDLPGGHVEAYETTPEETMNREVMEEACMTVRAPILVDVVSSDYFQDRLSYMLFYAVYVDELKEFIPNDESSERLVIDRGDFLRQYTAWDKDIMNDTIASAWRLLKESDQL